MAFNGDRMRDLATHFLALAEKHGATVPLMVGHRLMGIPWCITGDIAQGREHYNQAIALYDPAEHRPLATRFGQDVRVSVLSYRSLACGCLAIPRPRSQTPTKRLSDAREIGQAATLMYALIHAALTHILCGDYVRSKRVVDELVGLANEKGSLFWKATE